MSAKAEEYDEQEAPPNPPPAPSGYDLGRQWTETIFPMKLYDILCNPEFHHAISWMPHGRSWKVLNKDFFMEEICPQYFAQTRYESFIRQVNGWGFKRMRREGPDRSSYYHEHFLRGYPNLIDHMRRPAPGEKSRDLREEPDFYSLNPMPPLPTPPPRDPNSRNSQAKKAGRPLGSVTSHLTMPRAHSSFDAVTPRSDPMAPPGAHPYPYPMQPGAPWTGAPQWPGYPGYPPPPAGYWAQPPPMHAAQFRPPGYPPGYPMAWPQQPPGAPGQAAMMPYPYQMYDPSQYYAAYPQAGQPGAPPQPSTPLSGVNIQGAGASSSGSRRSRDDGDQSQDEQQGSASKRQRSSGDACHGPPPAHPLSAGEAQYPQAGAAGLPPGMPPGMMYQHPMYMANPAMMQQQQQQQEPSGGNVAPFSPIRQDPSQQHQQQPPPRHPQQQGQGQRQQPGPNEYESYNHPPGNNGAPPGAGGYGGYNDMERNL